ncbi:hypothetical protein RJT34_30242 [Clitoria ternatea]|uniref:Terpene synthase metal-binding domain-containing protein n=1 Tax=Clitoria ternatea TaxID=43366 RepID=A0AAN9ES06_CLITE
MECKLTSITGVLDDTYDAYATIEELELITKAIQRWNTSPLDSLPNQSMKVVVDALIELLAGIELMMAQDGKSCLIQYIKGAVQSLSKSYMIEAIWRNEGIIPTYEEYQDNGFVSSAYPLLQISFFLFLRKFATKEVFDWFSNKNIPKIVKASSLLARLMNDVASYKFESERGTVVSAVECCIKQYGIFEEESHKLLLKEMQNHWKDINEDCITPNMVSRPVLEVILNFTRVLSVMYENNEDRYTHGELLKDHVTLLFLDPIVITH